MTLNIPDGLPVLSSGAHPGPRYGACFMEFTALLAGETFNDHPTCVDPSLGSLMQLINDTMTDENRIRLVPLLGRAVGLVAPGWHGRYRSDGDMTSRTLVRKAGWIFAHKLGLHLDRGVYDTYREFEGDVKAVYLSDLQRRPLGDGATSSCSLCRDSARQDVEWLVDRATKAHEAYEEAMEQLGWKKREVKVVGTEVFLPAITPALARV